MPRHNHPPGYGKGKRGRHKRQHSQETHEWEKQHQPPVKPAWMPQETYDKLRAIRDE